MQDYALTVIIPNYNKAQYLATCIESILAQSLVPQEILVVDDCSTDRSLQVVSEIAAQNPRVRVIALSQNGGVSNARNTGASAAATPYITFVDSDDFYYEKDKLKKEMELIRFYREEKNQNIVSYSSMVYADTEDRITKRQPLRKGWYLNGNAYYSFLARKKAQTTPRDFCMRKEDFLRAGGYSYPKNFYEDLDLLVRLSKVVPFYFTSGYGTAYRQVPGGLSRRPVEEHREAVKAILDQYRKKESVFVRFRLCMMNVTWKIKSRWLRLLDRLQKEK